VDYSDKEIICHLIPTSTSQTSVTQVNNSCPDVPRDGAIRNKLKNSGVGDVQLALNQMLKDKVIETLPLRALTFAIDSVFIPFYGKEENEGDTIKCKVGDYQVLCLCLHLCDRNKCYTLAVKYIRKGESSKYTIDFLLDEVEQPGFKIKELYLDREFFTVEVMKYLHEKQLPFTMPCVLRGRCGGIRILFVGRKSYSTRYTMHYKDVKPHSKPISW